MAREAKGNARNIRTDEEPAVLRLRLLAAAMLAAGLASPSLHAAPEGGAVRGGSAALDYAGAETRVRQSSERAIIDWRSFDVGAHESVRFEQPSARSATLNRVGSGAASQIDGRLLANGQVYIVNRAGVIFGRSARINVAGLIATTSNIGDADFIADRLKFLEPGEPGAEVRNKGQITAADGGLVALVAPRVGNDGIITARLGRIALGSGERFTVDLDGDQLIRFALPAEDAQRLENAGKLLADGGEILLISAATARHVVDSVVNLGGLVRADTVEERGGRIILSGAGSVVVDGELQASGHGAGESGGTIHLGGSWQGGDGERAKALDVSSRARISADGGSRGDGGEVVLWSDGDTRFAGTISARGGDAGGDGGRVEVSGKTLEFAGAVDAGAPAGVPGRLLLDPTDINVGAREASSMSRVMRTGTTIALQADRDITVGAAIDGRGGSAGGGLALDAGRDIAVNDFILTNDGAIDLLARSGTIGFAAGKAVFAGGAPISATAGGQLTSGVLLSTARVSLASTGANVVIGGQVDPGNGPLEVSAATDIDVAAPVLNLGSGASVNLAAGGDVAVNAQINGFGAGVPGGAVTITAGGKLAINENVVTENGPVSLSAGGEVGFAEGKAVFAGSAPIAVGAGERLAAGSVISSGPVSLASSAGAVEINAPVEPGNGDLTVSAATDIAVNAPIVNLAAGSSVALGAGRDIDVNAQINGVDAPVAGGSVSLDAGRDIRIAEHIATADGAVSLTAGGAISQAVDKLVSAGNAPISVRSGGALTSGSLLSGASVSLASSAGKVSLDGLVPDSNGDLEVTAAGDIEVNQPLANPRAGSRVDLHAGGNIVVAAQIDGLGASRAGEVALQADGDILIERFIATTLAPITALAAGRIEIAASGGAFAESAAVLLRAGGDLLQSGSAFSGTSLSLVSTAGSVHLLGALAPGGAVSISSGLDLTIGTPLTTLAGGQTLALSAPRDILISSQIDGRGGAAGGGLSVNAGRNLTISGAVITNNGAIDLVAGGSGDFANSRGLFAGTAPVSFRAGSGLQAGPVSTGGAVTLTASAGTLTLSGPISGGNVTLGGGLGIAINNSLVASSTLTASTGGSLGITSPVQGQSVALSAGTLALGARVVAGSSLGVTAGSINGGGGLFSGGDLGVSSSSSLNTGSFFAAGSLGVSSGGTLTVDQAIGGLPGGVSLSAGGDLNLDAPIANLGGGASLSAGGTVRVDSQIDNIAGGIQLSAGQDALINDHIVASNSAINVTAGGTIAHLADGVDAFGAPQSKQLRAGSGNISETAANTISTGSMITSGSVRVTSTGGDINVDVPIYETTGFTRLVAAGDININQVIANATTGANLELEAGGAINVNAKVGPWDRTTGTTIGRNALPGGNVSLTAVGDINIGAEIATFKDVLAGDVAQLNLSSTAGAINFTAADLRVMSDFGNVTVTSFADLTNGPSLADVNAVPTTGYYTQGQLSLNSTGGDVIVDRLIPVETGSVHIEAFDQVRVNQRIYTNDGDITILAGAGGIIQNTTLDPSADPAGNTGVISDIDARQGNVRLEAVGDILPTLLRTGSTLTVKSTAGTIIGGQVAASRDLAATPGSFAFPDLVELAGFAGINGFDARNSANVAAISSGGSISSLFFDSPATLLMIAGVDILNPAQKLGADPRLFAGRDITLSGVISTDLEAKAGRNLSVAAGAYPIVSANADLSAGTDPFAALGATTVAGVAPPAWGGPFGPGNITIGGPGDIVWITGIGGFVANATGDITIPKIHVSYLLSTAAQTTDARQLVQPLTMAAGGNASVEQIETTGPVSIVSTGGDVSIGATIGAHVAPLPPADELWNPTDLGVASLLLRADTGNITMREARAEGDITIAAPGGQVVFVGPNGVEAGGLRSVTDSDGVVVGNTIDPTNIARLPAPSIVAPAVSPGPTLAGPGAPPIPGAIPPAGPPGVTIASVSGAAVGVNLGAPAGGGAIGQNRPGGIAGSAAAGPGGADVGPGFAPSGGGDGFGEIFVAAADQGVGEVRDPVRVEARRSSDRDAEDEPLAMNTDEREAAEADSSESGGEVLALAEQDEDEEKARAGDDEQEAVVVFAGGRGDARERDFGSGLPLEDGRVRP